VTVGGTATESPEDFDRPLDERRIEVAQLRPDLGERAYRAWTEKPDRHPY
jgi:guanine deaminase